MATSGGPKITTDNLLMHIDAGNVKSNLRPKQSSNILVDPNTWTLGTGGSSGYGTNGSSSEQNRLYVNDDPWSRRSISWRTTPDNVSGADGGWNTSSYSIDTRFTYRWSIWVRRYTVGTGGTFYLGMNPAPIRNDNNTLQGNPYFTYTAISSLTHNQWYLVVGHCFYESYTGGRHPDSGWYQNGQKISDLSNGNVGNQDVRWNPGTTSALHRAYHYYTTNINSGIEFSYPRLDKCDGSEPSISDIINIGESGLLKAFSKNPISQSPLNLHNGVGFNYNNLGSFTFDGVDEYIDRGSDVVIKTTGGWSISTWVNYNQVAASYNNTTSPANFIGSETISYNSWYWSVFQGKLALWNMNPGTWRYGSTTLQTNTWYNTVLVCSDDGTRYQMYLNGVAEGGDHTTYSWNPSFSGLSFRYIGMGNSSNVRRINGRISNVKIFDKALNDNEVLQNYNALKSRYGL